MTRTPLLSEVAVVVRREFHVTKTSSMTEKITPLTIVAFVVSTEYHVTDVINVRISCVTTTVTPESQW